MKNSALKEVIKSKDVVYLRTDRGSIHVVVRTGIKGKNALYKAAYLGFPKDGCAAFTPLGYELSTHYIGGQEIGGSDEIPRAEFLDRVKAIRDVITAAVQVECDEDEDRPLVFIRNRRLPRTLITKDRASKLLDAIEALGA